MSRQPRQHIVRLYPEVGVAGSLRAAMQAELDRVGYTLTASLTNSPGWWDCATRVGDDRRHVTTVLGGEQRWFTMDFWERGVMMAHGSTADLVASAAAIGLWQTGSRLRELQAASSFVRFGELAEAYERGDPVETKWKIYRRTRAPHIDHDLIEAAYAQPRLRTLFPYTSHESLRLSRCTREPFTDDLPAIIPLSDGTYQIIGPRPRSPIGHANTPSEAVSLLIHHLPDNCGPAVDATAVELGNF
ncbi:DUF6193 family natural product biosynthesis protein [Nocardia bhagyanarayanae]|uniref:Uncharacterized protein n=1 Tax=Nocardia bhagyanarayanae TaxID=1215925 RepID=A0A543FHZ4_9NOCA|nr:DUF6193 family natural product biosynthesis protein [Nocardia bhagyanarayanae]TQM33479.1 hypothetical protein FB390_5209 [Nocardia bhagyanarayanae]